MRLEPFLLEVWLDTYEHGIEFNLAASTGPTWTANEVLELGGEACRQRHLNHKVGYSPPAGADSLREAIVEMQGFAGSADNSAGALGRMEEFVRSCSAKMATT